MKSNLEKKLKEYYNKLHKPDRVIGNWAIIDTKAHDNLSKIKLTNISCSNNISDEIIIFTESKSKYIAIKYNFNFIAVKLVDREYECYTKDWDLIAVDKQYLYDGKINKRMNIKEIIKLLGFKLTTKAKKDLNDFD